MLVEAGLLSETLLAEALEAKKESKLKLGQFLIRQSLITEGQLVDLLSTQLRVEKYRPDRFPVDMELAKLIPSDLAQKHQVVPLSKKGSLLILAMTDPMDLQILDTLEVQINAEIEPVICTEQELGQLISSVYGAYKDLGGVLEGMEEIKTELEKAEATPPAREEVEVSSLHDQAQEVPVVRLVNSVMAEAIRQKASDVHISPEKEYVQVRFRVDGRLREVPAPPKTMFLPMVSRIKILSDLDIAVTRIPQDGRFTVKMQDREINVRASTMPTIYGENLVLRLLDTSSGVYTLDRLGMSPADRTKIESMIQKPYGLILATGPTGSGKSTTLYSILKILNRPDINIITLEDPVEYRMEKIRQVQLNRRAGMTFASGLRAILRQDPDVVMVGEIRDTETATIATQAALTGHRVLSTVHTNDAAGAITRFMDMGVEPFLVSSVMLVSCAQRLVRAVCSHCKEPYRPAPDALAQLGLKSGEEDAYLRGRGCVNCMNTGYRGRSGLYEVLVIDEMIQEMILNRATSAEITRAAHEAGKLTTLREDAADKVRRGVTTLEEAVSAVMT